MQNTKLYAVFMISVMLAGIFTLSPVISSLMNGVVIRSTGRIGTVAPIAYKSEIRGVFFHEVIFGYSHNWTLIANTLAPYGINCVFINLMQGPDKRPDSEWFSSINAFHSVGIKVIVDVNVLGDVAYNTTTSAVTSTGSTADWNNPINPVFRTLMKNAIENVTATYDIDGFMWDYIRYATDDMDYSSESRAAFETWLGEGPITNWTQFYPNQPRWNEFAEWRTIPVTDLVRDMRSWALAIKPNLEFSLAAWTYFSDVPIYWRKFIGQDTGAWIKEEYLDLVAPMMYTQTIYGKTGETLESEIDADLKYMTGGSEGKIPLVACLDCARGITPEGFKAEVDYVRSRGLDGFIIWRYGGPGSGLTPDIRDFLSILDMPDAFALRGIEVSASETVATINWTTDLPATSRIEYSASPLFNASWKIWDDFHYWDTDHINGTIKEDNANVTSHSIILTELLSGTKYYFRVQSQDESGIATSKVLTFTAGS